MDAITHTILAIIVIAIAWYGGRYMLIREARSAFPEHQQDIQELRRFMKLITAINHMGITPEPKEQEQDQEPTQLDLFLTQGSTGGTD
jgi:hypothetical protein|tara:strand:- start:31 stop:294 length:264 start_codon:yes stop_codon:yes gene_type:complete